VSLSPLEYIRHIFDEIDFILSQLPGQDYASFSRNPTLKRAFVRSLEVIGEAAKNTIAEHILVSPPSAAEGVKWDS